jgi:hypothetical protein
MVSKPNLGDGGFQELTISFFGLMNTGSDSPEDIHVLAVEEQSLGGGPSPHRNRDGRRKGEVPTPRFPRERRPTGKQLRETVFRLPMVSYSYYEDSQVFAPIRVHAQRLVWELPRLIYAIATAPEAEGTILFSKLDIKDGYWRMVVPEDDEWHFAYVLPKASPDEPTQLVIPSSLQMGWCDSPAYFCAASETARDVKKLAAKPEGSLDVHPLEGMLLRPQDWPELEIEQTSVKFTKLLEVYIDDFIQLAQTTDPNKLRHLSRAVRHGIHSVFPPTKVSGHTGEDPVSQKKLEHGDGLWALRKEILGWVFDGARRCIERPSDKVTKKLQPKSTE